MNRDMVGAAPRSRPLCRAVLGAVLLAMVVPVVPLLLLAIGGWPLVHLGEHRGGGTAASGQTVQVEQAIHWLSETALAVAWVAWAWMTVCVVIELRSWFTGRSPVLLPGSRTMQSAAAFLVGALLALSASSRHPPRSVPAVPAAAGSPPVGGLGHGLRVIDDSWSPPVDEPPEGPAELATGLTAASIDTASIDTASIDTASIDTASIDTASIDTDDNKLEQLGQGSATAAAPTPTHRVTPRDTLWSIAAARLGSSLRWKEIAHLNYGMRQADGGSLTTEHWVRPGWLLNLPSNRAEASEEVAGQQHRLRPATLAWSGIDGPAVTARVPPPAPPAVPDPAPAIPTPLRVPLVPVGGSIVGSGVVGILDRMRRAQQRHRAEGTLIRLPTGPGRLIEQRLRLGDGPDAIRVIDASLRVLVESCARAGVAVPAVLGAKLFDESIELVIEELPDSALLADVFDRGEGGGSIVVDRALLADLDRRRPGAAPHGPSPAPLLVTTGRSLDATVLVNLEPQGSITIRGDGSSCESVTRSLALELATSHRADEFDLVLIGFGTELERFSRVEVAAEIPELIRRLCRRQVHGRGLLDQAGYRSFAEARSNDRTHRWDPVLVLCGPSVDGQDRDDLLDVACAPDVGMSIVACLADEGGSRGATLSTTHSQAPLDLIGAVLAPQRVEADDLTGVAMLLDTAASHDAVLSSDEPYVRLPLPVPKTAPTPRPTAGQRLLPATGTPGTVEIAVLGPIEIRGAARQFTRAWAEELVVYLAMHPNGATTETWATALWPDRLMAPSSLHSTASVARRSLGQSSDGSDHLPRSHGRLTLAPTAVTDWQRFAALMESEEPEAWRTALGLVRGRPFEGLRSSDWPILEGIAPAIEASVVDLSTSAAEACLLDGDSRGAEWSARQGLLVSPYDERLYRLLMRAADASGNPAGVEAAMAELITLVAEDVEPFDSVHPTTMDLYRSLTRRRHQTGRR